MKELLKATGWQPHSVRGFLSGAIRKKMELTVTSTLAEDGGAYLTPSSPKKADVIAMMKRAARDPGRDHGSYGWQSHTVRGFVSILGSKGGEKIESSKTRRGCSLARETAGHPVHIYSTFQNPNL